MGLPLISVLLIAITQ